MRPRWAVATNFIHIICYRKLDTRWKNWKRSHGKHQNHRKDWREVVSLVLAAPCCSLFYCWTLLQVRFYFMYCFVVILVVVVFELRYLSFKLPIFSLITSTHLYIEIFVYLANRLNVHSFCGVTRVVFINNIRSRNSSVAICFLTVIIWSA